MDNLIDFPCAPMWAEAYAEQGMTTGYPRGFNPDIMYHPWRYRKQEHGIRTIHEVHFVELETEHDGGVDV